MHRSSHRRLYRSQHLLHYTHIYIYRIFMHHVATYVRARLLLRVVIQMMLHMCVMAYMYSAADGTTTHTRIIITSYVQSYAYVATHTYDRSIHTSYDTTIQQASYICYVHVQHHHHITTYTAVTQLIINNNICIVACMNNRSCQ